MKHTPAPWKIDDSVAHTAINSADGEKHIAMVNYGITLSSLEEHEANTHLIAVAPEMLDALITTNTALIIAYMGRDIPENIANIIEENRQLISTAQTGSYQ